MADPATYPTPKGDSQRHKLTDAEIIAAIEAEEALAIDWGSGELMQQRSDALARYRGAPLGNEIEGRSQVIDKSVLDTIEWIMPSLVRIYLGGDEIGKFEPRGPQDEAAADIETQVCNWYLEAKNDFFSQINATLRDALLLKNGYMVAYWQKKYDTMTEQYIGQSDDEFHMLAQDPEVDVVEHTEYPDPNGPSKEQLQAMYQQQMAQYQHMMAMRPPPPPPQPGQPPAQQPPAPPPPQMGQVPTLHDVKVERKSCEEFVAVESIPPEEMRVTRLHRWTSLADANFVQWVRRVTIGQLRAEGFDVPDDAPTDQEFTMEEIERERYRDVRLQDDNGPDPSRRLVTFKDTYYRVDLRGTGIPQLWRICHIESMRELLLKEEADIIPFAAFSPIIYPHNHVGTSVFDLIDDIGLIKTQLQRNFLDGEYLNLAQRTVIDVARVNMDDLLVARPGGIVRVDGDPSTALMPLAPPTTGQSTLAALEYMDSVKEGRTGVTRYSAGLDANTLNKTATGIQQIQAAANQRIELIARTLTSGFKDLFLIVHALALKHSTKALQIKLNGKWQPVNPREWTRRTDFSISVGLGTGTPEQQLQKLVGLMPIMQAAQGFGLSGQQEFYDYATEIWKAAGYKFADKFVHPPQTDPHTGQPIPPPQPPNPIVQAEQIKAQAAVQGMQMKSQADQAKAQADQQVQAARAQADMQIQQQKIASDAQLESAKTEMQLQLDDLRHSREQDTQIKIANIKAAAQVESARITASQSDGKGVLQSEMEGSGDPMQPLMDQIGQLAQHVQALHEMAMQPKQVVRDQNGRVVGVQSGSHVQQVTRDSAGRMVGLQ